MNNTRPSGLSCYRVLTRKDDATFCHRVSEALDIGYKLYGSPAVTFNGEYVVVAQALMRPAEESQHPGQGDSFKEPETS
jgi:hypothetical protein